MNPTPPKPPRTPLLTRLTLLAILALPFLLIYFYVEFQIKGPPSIIMAAGELLVGPVFLFLMLLEHQAIRGRPQPPPAAHINQQSQPAKPENWETYPKADIQRTQADITIGNSYRLEFTKHILTLSVGTLAFTTSFGPKSPHLTEVAVLVVGWVLLAISIIAGSASLYYWERFYISYRDDYHALLQFQLEVGDGPIPDATKATPEYQSALASTKTMIGKVTIERKNHISCLRLMRFTQVFFFNVGMGFIICFAVLNLANMGSIS